MSITLTSKSDKPELCHSTKCTPSWTAFKYAVMSFAPPTWHRTRFKWKQSNLRLAPNEQDMLFTIHVDFWRGGVPYVGTVQVIVDASPEDMQTIKNALRKVSE